MISGQVVAIVATAAIGGTGVLIDSAELFVRRKAVLREFPQQIIAAYYVGTPRTNGARAAAQWLTAEWLFSKVLLVRALGAIAAPLLIAGHSAFAFACCLIVFLAGSFVRARLIFGLDGADQMQGILWAGLCIAALDPLSITARLAIFFVACQLALSYLSAGTAKLISREWRSGAAIAGILATETYGSSAWLRAARVKPFAILACWGTIGFELGAPILASAGGYPGIVAAALCAVAFHLVIAVSMGLNGFTWAFLGALPCGIYSAIYLQHIAP